MGQAQQRCNAHEPFLTRKTKIIVPLKFGNLQWQWKLKMEGKQTLIHCTDIKLIKNKEEKKTFQSIIS